tara:strand:+ start:485 stop:607 length:123 start_codon:yes stop_codon:yes gene_type:complete
LIVEPSFDFKVIPPPPHQVKMVASEARAKHAKTFFVVLIY